MQQQNRSQGSGGVEVRRHCRSRATRRAVRLAAWGAAAAAASGSATLAARAGDNYLYFFDAAAQQAGQPAYWDVTGQPYGAWYDQTVASFNGAPYPPPGAIVLLLSTNGLGVSNLAVNYNHTYFSAPSASLAALVVDSGNTVVQSDPNSAMYATGAPAPFGGGPWIWGEHIGSNGVGSYVQSDGLNSVTTQLYLGENAGGVGSYSLTGGQLSTGFLIIGGAGRAAFTQSGLSARNFAGGLTIASSAGGSGTLTLGGGTLNIAAGTQAEIGAAGNGTLQQSAGVTTVGSAAASNYATVWIGHSASGSGSWQLSGTSTATVAGQVLVGDQGQGSLTLSNAAQFTVQDVGFYQQGAMTLGNAAGARGTVTLNGGTITLGQGPLTVGNSGSGSYVQTSGSSALGTSAIYVGGNVGGTGSVSVSGGFFDSNSVYVGRNGAGTFDLSGGTHRAGLMVIGDGATGSGTYSLSGSAHLQNLGGETVGNNGRGTFVQTGGSHSIKSDLYLGFATAAAKSFSISGSSTLSAGKMWDGYWGIGTMTQAGGASVSASSATLAARAGSQASYDLSGASSLLQLTAGGTEVIGDAGAATFNQSGGTHAISSTLTIANALNSSGTYTLSGGSLAVTGAVVIGATGRAVFNQLGGTFTTGTNLTLAQYAFGGASYTMSNAASLSVGGSEFIGGATNATFLQYGGAHTIRGSLTLAAGGPSPVNPALTLPGAGTYRLYGGTLGVGSTLQVSGTGTATFDQQGGSVTAATLNVGNYKGAATYSMSNNATLNVLGNETLIGSGTNAASFVQYGGTHTVSGTGSLTLSGEAKFQLLGTTATSSLNVVSGSEAILGTFYNGGGVHTVGSKTGFGTVSVAVGSYQQDAGQTTIYGNMGLGTGGIGDLLLNGGTFRLTNAKFSGSLFVGMSQPGRATMTAGTLIADFSESLGGGSSAPGTFLQSGGVNQTSYLDVGSLGSGTYTLSGGTLTVLNNEQVGEMTRGTFTQSGGTHTVGGTLTVRAGTATAGTLNVSGGSLTAAATVNNDSINQSGGTTSFGALTGSGTVTLSAAAGAALMNVTSFSQASVKLTGGALQVKPGAASVTNVASSVSISGAGVLDLNDSDFRTSTAASTVRQYLVNGYNAGAWNGTAAAIVSTAAAQSSPSAPWTLGYATGGADLAGVAIPAGQTLVKYTIPGDADLSGTVDFNDFLSLQNDYGSSGDWAQGDFNYDGVVDYNDYLMLQANYGRTPTGLDASIGAAPFIAAPTPEPAALGLVAIGAVGLLSQRRRSRNLKASN